MPSKHLRYFCLLPSQKRKKKKKKKRKEEKEGKKERTTHRQTDRRTEKKEIQTNRQTGRKKIKKTERMNEERKKERKIGRRTDTHGQAQKKKSLQTDFQGFNSRKAAVCQASQTFQTFSGGRAKSLHTLIFLFLICRALTVGPRWPNG